MVSALLASLSYLLLTAPLSVSLGPDNKWKVVEGNARENYYQLTEEDGHTVFHAIYPRHINTVTLAREVPKPAHLFRHVSWNWRVHAFPVDADERVKSKSDSACAFYATFGNTLHRQSLKYVWSSTLPTGTVASVHKTLFYDVVTIVLEGPTDTNVWKHETIDLAADWVRFYEPKRRPSEAPEAVAMAILTDGDETHSNPAADYSDIKMLP